jgi:histone deacetylase 1/2
MFCQLCGKEGHAIIKCFKRFNTSFSGPPQKSASSAITSYGLDSNWYLDSGATDHITSELEKLTTMDRYNGGDQVHAANANGVNITHIGHTTLLTPSSQVHLKNILYVPNSHKNLVYVHQLTHDNNAYNEFYPTHFSLKEQSMKKTLLQGRCEEGLYPLLSSSRSSSNKEANGAVKSSKSLWHHRLGHASSPIVRQVLSRNNIFFVNESNNHVCNACQQGKCHQLPYPRSTSMSASPLDLIFSDVRGPAPASVGRNQYYLSFIDDHNNFVWVYLLRHKSQVFQSFQDFQQLVERKFDRKIKAIQTD